MTLDTPDAEHFDHTVARVASDLRQLGDTDTLDVRRARAVGILADPQHALDLMSGREGAAPSPGSGGVANLFVHLTPEDLQADLDQEGHRWHRCGHHRTPRRRDHPAAHRLAGPADRHRREDRPAPGPRPQRHHRGGPARPTRGDARTRAPARRALCVPRLPTRLPGLRPRPHQPLRPDRRRRTTRARPTPATSPRCVGPTTGSRPTPAWDYQRHDTVTVSGYVWTAPTGHQYDVTPSDRRPPRHRTRQAAVRPSSSSRANTDEPDRPTTPTPARSGPPARVRVAQGRPRSPGRRRGRECRPGPLDGGVHCGRLQPASPSPLSALRDRPDVDLAPADSA